MSVGSGGVRRVRARHVRVQHGLAEEVPELVLELAHGHAHLADTGGHAVERWGGGRGGRRSSGEGPSRPRGRLGAPSPGTAGRASRGRLACCGVRGCAGGGALRSEAPRGGGDASAQPLRTKPALRRRPLPTPARLQGMLSSIFCTRFASTHLASKAQSCSCTCAIRATPPHVSSPPRAREKHGRDEHARRRRREVSVACPGGGRWRAFHSSASSPSFSSSSSVSCASFGRSRIVVALLTTNSRFMRTCPGGLTGRTRAGLSVVLRVVARGFVPTRKVYLRRAGALLRCCGASRAWESAEMRSYRSIRNPVSPQSRSTSPRDCLRCLSRRWEDSRSWEPSKRSEIWAERAEPSWASAVSLVLA